MKKYSDCKDTAFIRDMQTCRHFADRFVARCIILLNSHHVRACVMPHFDAEFREHVLDIQKEYSDEKAKTIDKKIFDLYGLTQEERDTIGYIDFHNNGEDDEEDE